jgi:hypothetical protein
MSGKRRSAAKAPSGLAIAPASSRLHLRAMRIFNVDAVPLSERPSLSEHLLPDEAVVEAFTSTGTTILFTSRRIVVVQLQVLLAERLETSSFSYRSMQHFSLLTGASENRSEIRIWLASDPQPLHLRANEGTDLAPLHRLLVEKLV